MDSFKALLAGDTDEENQPDIVQLSGLVPPLQLDTQQCTMVIIMPRNKTAGGAVDHKEMVNDPMSKAKRIFDILSNDESCKTLEKLEHIKPDTPMSMADYQADVRNRLLEILESSGLQVQHFPSLDEDETFLKLFLPLDGPEIGIMAERLEYDMPLKESVYETIQKRGPYPGHKPMQNDDARIVVARTRFHVAEKDRFAAFRSIDAIRLLEFWLDQWVSLDEMVQQGVITCYFPCPSPGKIQEIHDAALTSKNWLSPSFGNASISIRPYFGETIAFYFKFVAHLAQSMLVPGIAGVVFFILRMAGVIQQREIGSVRTGFCLLYSIWAATLLQLFARHTSRTKQFWGVEESETFQQINKDWDPERTGERAKMVVNFATVGYVAAYVGGITALLTWQYNLPTGSWLASVSSLLLTLVIKGGNLLWSVLAPKLVETENHRTEAEAEEKLSALLAGVKLFVANFPFFSHCFLTNVLQAECGATFEEAASLAFPGFNKALLSNETLQALHGFAWKKPDKVCIGGCVPNDYTTAHLYSETNCDADVISNLTTFFVFAIITEIALLILPIILSYLEIAKEYAKMQKDSDSEDGQDVKPYSFLQWEAKKFPYEFGSWGGDKVNDFLDMAINYSIVACWGVIYPPMAAIAAIALFILLRLRVYRSLYVTRRPLPRASAGLGIWRTIFQCINVTAVACNVGLAALFFYPMRTREFGIQLMFFLIFEHAILILQATVKFLISDSPVDVTDIGHYNEYVKKTMKKKMANDIYPAQTSLRHVDVSLNPDNIESEVESDSS